MSTLILRSMLSGAWREWAKLESFSTNKEDKMQTLKRNLLAFLAASSIAMLSTGEVRAETELKVATLAPEGTPWYDWLATWKANVETSSEGELKLVIFPSAQLGNELDVWNKVARGRVDISAFSGAPMAENVPETAVMIEVVPENWTVS